MAGYENQTGITSRSFRTEYKTFVNKKKKKRKKYNLSYSCVSYTVSPLIQLKYLNKITCRDIYTDWFEIVNKANLDRFVGSRIFSVHIAEGPGGYNKEKDRQILHDNVLGDSRYYIFYTDLIYFANKYSLSVERRIRETKQITQVWPKLVPTQFTLIPISWASPAGATFITRLNFYVRFPSVNRKWNMQEWEALHNS